MMFDSSSIFLVFFLSFKIAHIYIYMGKPKMCKNHLFIKYLHSFDNMTLHLLQGDTIHITYKTRE